MSVLSTPLRGVRNMLITNYTVLAKLKFIIAPPYIDGDVIVGLDAILEFVIWHWDADRLMCLVF